jgi:AhpD family alkylhydroperoxidase
MNAGKAAPGAYRAMLGVQNYVWECGLDRKLTDLVSLRASQINGCAYCIDMHWKDLRAAGETEERLYMLNAWRESKLYSEKERAVLAWTESVTLLGEHGVPDDVYRAVAAHFSDTELANLTLSIAVINMWNRLNVAFRTEAGSYQPKSAHAGAHA